MRTRILNGTHYGIDLIPEGVIGQSYVLLSRSSDDFSDMNTIAGPAILQVRLETLSDTLPKVLKMIPLGLPESYDT